MVRHPFTKTLHSPTEDLLVLVCGKDFQVVDTKDGSIKASTCDVPEEIKSSVVEIKDGHTDMIRTLAFSPDGKLLATSGEDKTLKVWAVENWQCLNTRPVIKRYNAIKFAAQSDAIFVADKFGDVYKLQIDPAAGQEELLLGHVSMITDMVLSADNKHIITADRDEKIRVNNYPDSYNIHSFCLGHTEFVSAVRLPVFSPGTLISGGGDGMIMVWDYMNGSLKQAINLRETLAQHGAEPVQGNFVFVTSLVISQQKDVLVLIEKYNSGLVFRWNDQSGTLEFAQLISLSADPLDGAFDNQGNLWFSISDKSDDMVVAFDYKDGKYEQSETKPVNQFGSFEAESLPNLYPTGTLRKITVPEEEQNEQEEEEQPKKKAKSE
ncbi:WD40 repeat-like protein [Basidiobolus meristosporus CBS 931.73]|uniref:WD40 repeat-like protein n=1 Tax=Basidiobolus meristosporus CBS 931.73 TaxID=1314790 RepID=A0A1Y1XX06_9FUNG|nr:WD40 repeat-like protein [Basidiobolus meristosporus CBS 931.73]|eukprot:ORX90267.1 WD40 repeat-like protein [Basidiobolus meristosporus CBS 931.73]